MDVESGMKEGSKKKKKKHKNKREKELLKSLS
jgi:hypothetical protein